MMPTFEDGQTLIVSPSMRPRLDDPVLVCFRNGSIRGYRFRGAHNLEILLSTMREDDQIHSFARRNVVWTYRIIGSFWAPRR